jgi:hypothetical protein
VPVLNFASLITDAAPDSLPQGSATFGAPIFLDLGGRGVRSLDRNVAGQYLITAGPTGDATGIPPEDFRLFGWTGNPLDAPFDLGLDMTSLDIEGGSFESIAGLPGVLGPGTTLQLLLDNGDTVWYGDGIAAKDLPSPLLKKASSLRITVDVAFPAASVLSDCCSPQSATVNQPFSAPTSARVVDAYGDGVANVVVEFSAPAAGASALLSASQVTTDAQGYASITTTANTIAGTYDVVASVKGVATTASFEMQNLPDVPSIVEIAGGDSQSATVLNPFADSLAVRVTDTFGNAVSGVTVQYQVPAAGPGAELSASSVVTDANGDASVDATANSQAGGFFVAATVDAAQATFALTNLAGPAAVVAVTGGTSQSAVVNQPFAAPLALHVTDAEGNAVSNASVTFIVPTSGASAVLSATTVNTDASGNASVDATANAIAGSYAVSASVDGVSMPVTFDLTNTIDPAQIIFASGFDPD